MNEELQNTANEVLRGILENAASAKEFILSQTPDVVNQLLWWKGVESAIYFLILVTLAVVSLFAIRRVNNHILTKREAAFEAKKNKEPWTYHLGDTRFDITSMEYDAAVGVPSNLRFLLIIPSLIFTYIALDNLDWLQILIAPKLYLLEYAASLVQ